MLNSCDIAVVGATGLVGESLIALLEEREFPLGHLYLLAGPDSAGTRVKFRGGYVSVRELAGFDFSQVGLAIFATSSQVAAEFVPRATAAGCVVIDTSTQFRADPDVPLIVPEINATAIAGYRKRRLLATPGSAIAPLLLAIQPIHKAVGVESLSVTTLQPVSSRGRTAIEDLATQVATLLNGLPIESRVFPKQIGFNCLPDIDASVDNGYTKLEMQQRADARRVLDDDNLAVQFTCVGVPVFYGEAQVVEVVTRKPLAARDARRLLEAASGLQVQAGSQPGSAPSPVEVAGQDAIYVARIRDSLATPRGLSMWVVADNVRRGVAGNAVRVAEILVKEYL
jgi:aspartate-semialdehyde dehydrogenase